MGRIDTNKVSHDNIIELKDCVMRLKSPKVIFVIFEFVYIAL
jgi:hypothetical protein